MKTTSLYGNYMFVWKLYVCMETRCLYGNYVYLETVCLNYIFV